MNEFNIIVFLIITAVLWYVACRHVPLPKTVEKKKLPKYHPLKERSNWTYRHKR